MLRGGGDGDFLKLAFVRKSDSGNKWVEFLRSSDGSFDFSGNWHSGPGGDFGGPFLPADFGNTVYLRLSTTDGETFKGEFSKDGQTWESAGDDRQGFAEQDVGLYALRGAAGKPVAEAAFEDFKVSPDRPCAANRPPTVTATADPSAGEAPLPVGFSADATDPDGDDLAYEWDFGVDGTDADEASTKDASYTYEESGDYTATVTATDTEGAEATDTVKVAVSEPAPGDTTNPFVRGLSPNDGSRTRDRTPVIQAIARDETTDLAKADIEVYVDGRRRTFAYDAEEDRLRHVTDRLSYGRHTVRVVATDEAGNRSAEAWSFKVVRP